LDHLSTTRRVEANGGLHQRPISGLDGLFNQAKISFHRAQIS
jgi:hypothetical protein